MYNDHTIFHKIYSKVRASHLFIEPRPAGHGIRAYPEHASKVISTICKALGLKVVRIFCRVLLTWTNPQFGDALGTVTTSASLHHYICITTSASLHHYYICNMVYVCVIHLQDLWMVVEKSEENTQAIVKAFFRALRAQKDIQQLADEMVWYVADM